jgi:hypothetical protein
MTWLRREFTLLTEVAELCPSAGAEIVVVGAQTIVFLHLCWIVGYILVTHI